MITPYRSKIGPVYSALCNSIRSTTALHCLSLFKTGKHLDLVNYSINAEEYDSSLDFALDYSVVSFLAKYQGLSTGLNLREEALQKFITSEKLCLATNHRLQTYDKFDLSIRENLVFHKARALIRKILADVDPATACSSYGWGPGATSDLVRSRAHLDTKMSKLPLSVTPHALPFAREVLRNDLHWSSVICNVDVNNITPDFCFLDREVFEIRDSCNITTVAKNAKSDRVIAVEPRLNGYLQKGVGSYIRRRLKRFGVDLDDQTHNQEGAERAQLYELATIDLKAASDTVSIEIVYDLLPLEWSIYLDHLRSKFATLPDGSIVKLEKFSSMGNGFTFELESLLFYALARANESCSISNGQCILVYGDDIIVPQASALDLIRVLEYAGFQTNLEKTFINGRFFESCGRHYFDGVDVTPIYQKKELENDFEIIRLGNRIMRLGVRLRRGTSIHASVRNAREAARRSLSYYPNHNAYVPNGTQGDDGWLLTRVEWLDSRKGNEVRSIGLSCRVLLNFKGIEVPANDAALLAWTLRRGVRTEVPYLGEVLIPFKGFKPVFRRAWVIPTEEFGLDWV